MALSDITNKQVLPEAYEKDDRDNNLAIETTQAVLVNAEPVVDLPLKFLRTKAEVQARSSLKEMFIMEALPKDTNNIVQALNEKIPHSVLLAFQHLRRVSKKEYLPVPLKERILQERGPNDRTAALTAAKSRNARGKVIPSVVVLLGPVALLSKRALTGTVKPLSSLPVKLFAIEVPSTPPTSQAQAKEWSEIFWPTVYKSFNPIGPQPAAISKAEACMGPEAEKWMQVASDAAADALTALPQSMPSYLGAKTGSAAQKMGLPIGAVIVSCPSESEERKAVVVATDARWLESDANLGEQCTWNGSGGNPLAHAAMRAIGLLARKRVAARELAASNDFNNGHPISGNDVANFFDWPLTPAESKVYEASVVSAGGYLCTGLEIYLTHEPCVMCSMAIVHSRFEKVVFGKPQGRTGGLAAEDLSVTQVADLLAQTSLSSAGGESTAIATNTPKSALKERSGKGKRRQRGRRSKTSSASATPEPIPNNSYGLFWREGLNWKLLAWYFKEGRIQNVSNIPENAHA